MSDAAVLGQAVFVALVIISVGWGVQAELQRRARRRRRQLAASGRGALHHADRSALRPAQWRPRARATGEADVDIDLTAADPGRVEQAFAFTEAWGRAAIEGREVDLDDVVFVTPDPSAVRWSVTDD